MNPAQPGIHPPVYVLDPNLCYPLPEGRAKRCSRKGRSLLRRRGLKTLNPRKRAPDTPEEGRDNRSDDEMRKSGLQCIGDSERAWVSPPAALILRPGRNAGSVRWSQEELHGES